MVIETKSTAYLTTDSGLVVEIPQVTATYIAFGPSARGVFPASRAARARRSDARRHRRQPEFVDVELEFPRGRFAR